MKPFIATACVACGGRHLDRSPAVLMPFLAERIFGWRPVEVTADWGLRTVPTGWAMTVCNTLGCRDCGLLFLDMRFDDAQLQALYDDYRGEAYTALRERYEPGYAARNATLLRPIPYKPMVERFIAEDGPPTRAILDFGGDDGKNTPFDDLGLPRHVYDISGRPTVAGAERVAAEALRLGDYDLIVCSNVLEHTPWPLDVLQDIARLMDDGTRLYVEVPLEELVRTASGLAEAQPGKRHWHEHINFFTEPALHALAARAGLRVDRLARINVRTEAEPEWAFQLMLSRSAG